MCFSGIALVHKQLFKLLRGAALIVYGILAIIHAMVGLVVGIILSFVTGISWYIIVPISMVVAVLFVFANDDQYIPHD